MISSDLKELKQRQHEHTAPLGWDQFHSPEKISISF